MDAQGDVFVADTGNHDIREVTPTGLITTIASGVSTAAIAVDAERELFIQEPAAGQVVEMGLGATVTILAATTTSVTSSAAALTYGQPVTLTANVVAQSSSVGIPNSGTVTLYDGADALGTVPLSMGVATLTTSSLPAGTLAVTATYSGDALDLLADSNSGTAAGASITVIPAATATTLTTSFALSPTGSVATPDTELETLQATVAPQQAVSLATPTGAIQFLIGGTDINAPVTLASGTATITLTEQRATELHARGAAAVYACDTADFTGSTGTVPPAATSPAAAIPTATSVVASSASLVSGQAVTFQAFVTAQSPGSGVPNGGTVSFYDGSAVLGIMALTDGVASLTTTALGLGVQTISAVYSGDGEAFAGSSSGTIATIAGSPMPGYTGENAPAVDAELDDPEGLADSTPAATFSSRTPPTMSCVRSSPGPMA